MVANAEKQVDMSAPVANTHANAASAPSNNWSQEIRDDVDRKLKLFGVFCGFQQGKVPSNTQIDVALNSIRKSKSFTSPPAGLSSEGQKLIQDVNDVIKNAQHLLLSKNNGELLQDFIWQTENIGKNGIAVPGSGVDKETAQQHGNEALEGIKTLGSLIITNGQFRKLLSDASILLRDMAGDAATKAADKVRPSGNQLDQIDDPADDNTWHEKPDFAGVKDKLKSSVNKAPIGKGDLKEAAGNASQTANPNGSRDPTHAAQNYNSSSGVDAQSGLQAGASTIKDRLSENIPDEHKDKANELKQNARETKDATKQRTKQYLSKKMPEERREQAIWRLKKMIVEIQDHPDYMQAINTLLELAEKYVGHGKNIAHNGSAAVKDAHNENENNPLLQAESDLKILIERFANNTSSDGFFQALDAIYRDADNDPELKNWFKGMDRYIRRCLKEQGYVLEDDAANDWNQLYDRGEYLLRDRYRNHTDRILDELKSFSDQFEKDPMNRSFGDSLSNLFTDLGQDDNGKPTFKPHLLKDLKDVILPSIFSKIRYVPVPRIEYRDPAVDLVIENLLIESANFMPDVFRVIANNQFTLGRKGVANDSAHAITILVKGLQVQIRDVKYYLKKREGKLPITDTGSADLMVGGGGLEFEIKLSTAKKTSKGSLFTVDKVNVAFDTLKVKIRSDKHGILAKLLSFVASKAMKSALQKAVEKAVKDNLQQFDGLAYQIKQEADRAKQEVLKNPENAQNVYVRYVEAARGQMKQKQKKAEAVKNETSVNVDMGEGELLFPDVHLTGGISGSLRDYRRRATQGSGWKSDLFTWGSAKPSTDIPDNSKLHNRSSGRAIASNAIGNGNGNGNGNGSLTGSGYNGNDYGNDYNSNAYPSSRGNGFASGTTGLTSNGKGLDTGLTSSGNGAATTHTTLGGNNAVLTGLA